MNIRPPLFLIGTWSPFVKKYYRIILATAKATILLLFQCCCSCSWYHATLFLSSSYCSNTSESIQICKKFTSSPSSFYLSLREMAVQPLMPAHTWKLLNPIAVSIQKKQKKNKSYKRVQVTLVCGFNFLQFSQKKIPQQRIFCDTGHMLIG